jgi:hypothetical protein
MDQVDFVRMAELDIFDAQIVGRCKFVFAQKTAQPFDIDGH